MDAELTLFANRLAGAAAPEDVFGALSGLDELKKTFRQMAKIAHPDHYQSADDRSLAERTFTSLSEWFAQAESRLNAGQYGLKADAAPSVLRSFKREYRIGGTLAEGEIYTFYPCSYSEYRRIVQAELHIVRDPQDNDLGQNEVRILRILQAGKWAAKFAPYLPRLIDSFIYRYAGTAHQASVFPWREGWVSLEEIRQVYPAGIDPKDMAWMWRRLLVALGFAHVNGVIHGAVLPKNIWILPEQHGLLLDGWSFAAFDPEKTGERILAVEPDYESWYPEEVVQGEAPLPGTDIGMSAWCMSYILGGDPPRGLLPDAVPGLLQSFLKGCTLPGKRTRPQDAWGLKDELDDLLARLWGKRTFHPFTMKGTPSTPRR